MKYTYAFLVKYRYYIFWSLTVLLITEVVQPIIGIVSFEHEQFFVWLSLLTLLASMGIAVLIGVVSPVGHRIMNHAYFALVAVPLILFVNLGLLGAGMRLDIFWTVGIPFIIWIGIAGPTGAAACVIRNKKAYSSLVVFPLIMASWTGVLMITSFAVPDFAPSNILYSTATYGFVLILSLLATTVILVGIFLKRAPPHNPRTHSMYILILLKALAISVIPYFVLSVLLVTLILLVPFILPYMAAIVVAIAGTAFVYTINDSMRRIVTVAVIGLLAMTVVLGAYWTWTIDDGLGAFSGEERIAAEFWARNAEDVTFCAYVPVNMRISKNEIGYFQGRVYTFWRLPRNPCA